MNQVTFQKTLGKSLFLVLILVLAAGTVPVLAAEDITGDWEITMDFNGRQSFATLSISKKADGTFTGKWGSTELADVKFDGQKLTFVRTVKFGDQQFSTNYSGTLKDGKLTGTMSGERGDFAANGARIKPRSPVLGQWDIKFNVGDREITARLIVSEKPDGALEGKWTEPGEHVLSNVKFQDGKLTFTRKSKIEDMEFETTYEGTVKGNELTGMLKGEMGQWQANGQRVGTALVGKWELTSTSERGPRTRMLTIYGDLTGRYEMFGGEIPIKDLKLEGDQVSFKVEMGFGDQTFTMEFKGKLDGTILKGQMSSERGTDEVTGKKVEAASAIPASALVGTWEITEAASEGREAHTHTLKIKNDMTGTYSMRDSEVPITDLKVEGDQVSFKVNTKFNEQEVTMEFKGKLDGTTLKGQFITSRGTREITGKKISPTS